MPSDEESEKLIYIQSKACTEHAKVGSSVCVCRWVSKDGIGAVGRLFIGTAINSYKIPENQSY